MTIETRSSTSDVNKTPPPPPGRGNEVLVDGRGSERCLVLLVPGAAKDYHKEPSCKHCEIVDERHGE